jgi:hypothetical protein
MDISDPSLEQGTLHGASSVRGWEPATLRSQIVQEFLARGLPDSRLLRHIDPALPPFGVPAGIDLEVIGWIAEVTDQTDRTLRKSGG